MIKLYFLGVIGLLVALWFGLDGYMSSNQLSWKEIWIVWPLWALLTVAGFLLGGLVLGTVAQYAFVRDSHELAAQHEADKTAHQQSVENSLKEESDRLVRQEELLKERSIKLDQRYLDSEKKLNKTLKKKKKKANAEIEKGVAMQAAAEQLIIETKAENIKIRREAHNVQMVFKRMERKKNTPS